MTVTLGERPVTRSTGCQGEMTTARAREICEICHLLSKPVNCLSPSVLISCASSLTHSCSSFSSIGSRSLDDVYLVMLVRMVVVDAQWLVLSPEHPLAHRHCVQLATIFSAFFFHCRKVFFATFARCQHISSSSPSSSSSTIR